MANYNSNLKVWGDVGSEYPTGYGYEQEEQPVDGWDNYFNYHVSTDIEHLIELTNKFLESESGTEYPTNPEPGHLVWRSDNRRLAVQDATNSSWREFAYRNEHDALRVDHEGLQDAHDVLRSDHDTLRAEHDVLDSEVSQIQAQLDGYEIQVNGTDGPGIINFITE